MKYFMGGVTLGMKLSEILLFACLLSGSEHLIYWILGLEVGCTQYVFCDLDGRHVCQDNFLKKNQVGHALFFGQVSKN